MGGQTKFQTSLVIGWLLALQIDVELGLKEVHYCECIVRDIGCGCGEEDGMLWKGVGGRLGVDLCGLLGLEA